MEDLAHCEEFSPPRMRSLMVSTNAWVDVLSLQFEKTGSKPWNEVLLSASRTVPIHQHMSQFWVKRTKCLKGLWLACMFGASEESGSLQCWPFEVLAPHVLTVGPHFIVFVFLALQVPVLPTGSFQQLQPLSFGEGIALDPLPAKEIRWVHIRPEEMLLKKKTRMALSRASTTTQHSPFVLTDISHLSHTRHKWGPFWVKTHPKFLGNPVDGFCVTPLTNQQTWVKT